MIPLAFAGGDFYVSKEKHTPLEHLISKFNNLSSKSRAALTVNVAVAYAIVTALLAIVNLPLLAVLSTALFGILISLFLAAWVFRHPEGDDLLAVALPIQEGSEGFFAVQYSAVFKISLLTAAGLFLMYFVRDSFLAAFVCGLTFLLGAGASSIAGYAGMWVSVRANVRVAEAAKTSYSTALLLCFRAGAFASVMNISLVIFSLSVILVLLRLLHPLTALAELPNHLVGFGFGASLVALFAQLGGGIYTKGADVGADLVGKVEQGIPEDDPRNPAVIADLVGDNCGDCAGQCADTFESIAAEIVSAMILGGALAKQLQIDGTPLVLFPLCVHCLDVLVSSVGIFSVRVKSEDEDPLVAMKRGLMTTLFLSNAGFALLTRLFLNFGGGWFRFYLCGLIGNVCAYLFVLLTQYFTDYAYPKVRSIATASLSGPATNVIAGLAVGMESTALPVVLIVLSLVASFTLGTGTTDVAAASHTAGLFGTAVATMGMLSSAGYILSMSNFGPIADNAGGIVEMSQLPESVRTVTDRLDAVGNVTKANTKGYSVGSAALACFLLFAAFMDEVDVYIGDASRKFDQVNLARVEVFGAGLLGAGLVFLFSAWAMEAVGRTAQEVVAEVRKQFREKPGIMTYVEKPDYHRCVAIVSQAALKEMVKPGLLAVTMPIVVGFLTRLLGEAKNDSLLGPQCVAAFLMFSTSTGILMALFLNNAGGAWDNAKKFVETGAHGGKGSDAHKAAVVGDTVGDPCKDAAGPSVHVLIKLLSTVTMVMIPLFCTKKNQ